MSQIHWMLSLIPESVLLFIYYSILVAGFAGMLAGWILKWIPGIAPYKTPLQILGVVLTVFSVYLIGGYDTEVRWRNEVAKMQEKVNAAEAAAAATTRAIETKVEVQTKIVREKGKDIIKYVDREVVKKEEIIKYIEQCPVPKEIIDLHNQATELNKAAEGKK